MSTGTIRRSTLGNYRLVDFIGAGGMGEVHRAMHLVTGRVAAVKILTAGGQSPATRERFRNEARIQATLSHPHIVTLYDFFEAEGSACIAMEYVGGASLEQMLRAGPIEHGQALRWFAQIADAVSYVHQRGIVHRDLKPNNIKIDDQGRVKLLDFGIAKSGDSPKLTTDGNVIGTLHYLAPEQVRGAAATPSSDIWALGVVLYEMVTGRVPFASDTLTGVMMRILNGSYEPPSVIVQQLPRDIDRIVARCLEGKPDKRYPSAAALLSDVRAALGPAERASTPRVALSARGTGELASMIRRRAPLVGAVTAAVLAALYVAWASWTCCAPPIEPRTERPPGTETVPSVPTPNPGTPNARAGASDVPAGPLTDVTFKVFGESQAAVFVNGDSVGMTPLTIRAQVGDWVDFTLKRSGYYDLAKKHRVYDGTNMIQEALVAVPPADRAGSVTPDRNRTP
jgi:serine/threonine-protein kinase